MKTSDHTQLPIHFKKPGRSYSQIGRKGNVALYSVYSDYFLLNGFVQPYLLIGFELIVIKTNRKGDERYPRDEEFGHSAWSIPKSFKTIRRVCSRLRRSKWLELCISKSKTFLDRSPAPEESALLAPA